MSKILSQISQCLVRCQDIRLKSFVERGHTQIWFWIRYIAKVILISRRYKFNKYLRQQTRKFKGRGWLKNNGNYFENYSWPLYTLINKVIGASKTLSRNKVSCYREAVIFQEFIYLACMTVSAPIQICIIFKPIGIQANFVQLYYHSTTYNETICSLLIFSTQCGILIFFSCYSCFEWNQWSWFYAYLWLINS